LLGDAEAEAVPEPTPLRLLRALRTAASWAADAPDAAQPAGEAPSKRKRGNNPKYVYGTQAEVVAHRCGPNPDHDPCPPGVLPELPAGDCKLLQATSLPVCLPYQKV